MQPLEVDMAGTDKTTRRRPGKTAYIFAIIINAVVLFVFNNFLKGHVPFLTDSFRDVLWAFDLSLGLTIAANALFLYYDPAWFRHLAQMVLNVFGFVAVYNLFLVFPFSFPDPLQLAVKIALIAAMVGLGIAFIVEFIRLVLRKD
jgi:hypothetical protein